MLWQTGTRREKFSRSGVVRIYYAIHSNQARLRSAEKVGRPSNSGGPVVATWDIEKAVAGGSLVKERGSEHRAAKVVQTRAVEVERIQKTILPRAGPKPRGGGQINECSPKRTRNPPLLGQRRYVQSSGRAEGVSICTTTRLTQWNMHLAGLARGDFPVVSRPERAFTPRGPLPGFKIL